MGMVRAEEKGAVEEGAVEGREGREGRVGGIGTAGGEERGEGGRAGHRHQRLNHPLETATHPRQPPAGVCGQIGIAIAATIQPTITD